MKPRKQKRSPKKKAAAAVAVLLALALSMGGTYMFLDHSQHKTNEAMGDLPAYDVRLVEEFEEVSGWKTTDPPLKKEIRVANVGKASDGFSGVYVRLQLKEYMEIAPLTYTQTAERYMMAQDGKFVVFESRAAAEAAYPGRIVTELTDAVAKTTGWFVQTKAHDSDGQYGKFVVTEITRGAASSLVEGVARADRDAAEKHQENTNGECAYTVHTWNGEVDGSYYNGKTMFPGLSDAGALTFHDFVQWQLGGNGDNLISLTDFLNPVGNNGAPVSKWIYDDRVVGVGTNWVYWGRLLEPQNNEESNPNSTTSNLLEKIRLLLQPQGSFYYAIHVDMQALSLDELGGTNKKWTDAPEGIINSYISHAPSLRLQQLRSSIDVDETVKQEDLVEVTKSPETAPVTWTSSDPTVAEVDPNTGDVTGKKTGTVTITATLPTGERASYTLTVPRTILKVTAANGEDDTETALLASDGTVWAFGDGGVANYIGYTYKSNWEQAWRDNWYAEHENDEDPEGYQYGADMLLSAQVVGLEDIVDIDASYCTIVALKADGTVYQVGAGVDSPEDANGNYIPQQVPGLTNIVSVVTTYDSKFAIDSNGDVWAWGDYADELGLGTGYKVTVPEKIPGLSNVKKIIAEDSCKFAITSGGDVWAWDGSIYYIMPDYDWDGYDGFSPIKLEGISNVVDIGTYSGCIYAVRSNGEVWQLSTDSYEYEINYTVGYQKINVPGHVVSMTGGGSASFALTDDGKLYGWGESTHLGIGQLDSGDTITEPTLIMSNVKSVAANGMATFVIKTDGTLWVWSGWFEPLAFLFSYDPKYYEEDYVYDGYPVQIPVQW